MIEAPNDQAELRADCATPEPGRIGRKMQSLVHKPLYASTQFVEAEFAGRWCPCCSRRKTHSLNQELPDQTCRISKQSARLLQRFVRRCSFSSIVFIISYVTPSSTSIHFAVESDSALPVWKVLQPLPNSLCGFDKSFSHSQKCSSHSRFHSVGLRNALAALTDALQVVVIIIFTRRDHPFDWKGVHSQTWQSIDSIFICILRGILGKSVWLDTPFQVSCPFIHQNWQEKYWLSLFFCTLEWSNISIWIRILPTPNDQAELRADCIIWFLRPDW